MGQVEMVIDSVRVALINYQRAVILKEKNGERYLLLWVGTDEADAVASGLLKVNACASGPLVHDFAFVDIGDRIEETLGKFGALHDEVIINNTSQIEIPVSAYHQ